MADGSLNRRQFLGSTARNAGMAAAGMAAGISALANAREISGPLSLGVVGLRNQGRDLVEHLSKLPDVRIAALCDVDQSQFKPVEQVLVKGNDEQPLRKTSPTRYSDYSQMLADPRLHGIVIATPDHWHAHMAIAAIQAGKAVYLETPLTHNFREGQALLQAAREAQGNVTVGLSHRSSAHFLSGIEFVRSGGLGAVPLVKIWTSASRKSIGHRRDMMSPEELDYDTWLGPAGQRPYNPNRSHYNWRWFWDYGGGELTNSGAQLIDVARWALDLKWPEKITSIGGKLQFEDDQETPDTMTVQYQAGNRLISWEHRQWTAHGQEGRSTAISFIGTNGTMILDRGGWKIYGQKNAPFSAGSDCEASHLQTFLNRVRSRETDLSELEEGHLSASWCHFGNISYRVSRTLTWESGSETFLNDAEANGLLGREYPAGWEFPKIDRASPAEIPCPKPV